jgi:hypothetical protein
VRSELYPLHPKNNTFPGVIARAISGVHIR